MTKPSAYVQWPFRLAVVWHTLISPDSFEIASKMYSMFMLNSVESSLAGFYRYLEW